MIGLEKEKGKKCLISSDKIAQCHKLRYCSDKRLEFDVLSHRLTMSTTLNCQKIKNWKTFIYQFGDKRFSFRISVQAKSCLKFKIWNLNRKPKTFEMACCKCCSKGVGSCTLGHDNPDVFDRSQVSQFSAQNFFLNVKWNLDILGTRQLSLHLVQNFFNNFGGKVLKFKKVLKSVRSKWRPPPPHNYTTRNNLAWNLFIAAIFFGRNLKT